MAEDIQGLIDKINQEGIQAAKTKAGQIETQAHTLSDEIIQKATREAQQIIAGAQKEASRVQADTKIILQQAGRDLLLNFKKEINALLEKLATQAVGEGLNPQVLAEAIAGLLKHGIRQEKNEIIISLNQGQIQKIQEILFSQLNDQIKKGIILKPSDDISAGFLISYDSAKSYYDFSDKSLAEYIIVSLKPALAEVLRDASA